MRILPYIAVMFTLLIAACSGETDKVAKEKMEIAHTLVSQNPDSAMSVLEGKPYGLIVYTHAYYVKTSISLIHYHSLSMKSTSMKKMEAGVI